MDKANYWFLKKILKGSRFRRVWKVRGVVFEGFLKMLLGDVFEGVC